MIVRISTENQYRLPDEHAGTLNDLDNAAVKAVDADDEDRYHELFEEMLQLVRTNGSLLEADELEESDVSSRRPTRPSRRRGTSSPATG